MNAPIKLKLPYAPSANTYWRSTKGRTGKYISERGKAFTVDVINLVFEKSLNNQIDAPLEMDILLYPPDRRKRDIDNVLKPTLDALQKAGVYKDDSQIVKLRVSKESPIKGGCMVVSISECAQGVAI